MKTILTASAIVLGLGLGAGTATQAAPANLYTNAVQQVEFQQVGFKRFKHRRHFRHRGFNHRRFRHQGLHHHRFRHRGFYDRRYSGKKVYKGGRVIKHGTPHRHDGRGVLLKKKIFTPFGVFHK